MATGVFTSLVSVLERSVPVPDGPDHRSPLASSLLHIISALITHNKEMYVCVALCITCVFIVLLFFVVCCSHLLLQ